MPNFIEELHSYPPKNEQEKADLEQMLLLLKNSPDRLLSRESKLAHFTASALIINPARDQSLLIYHRIYDSWCWCGGHADGENDLLQVALREASEETGLQRDRLHPIFPHAAGIEILPVFPHCKRGSFLSAHLHLNLSYILQADPSDQLHPAILEAKGARWFPLDEIATISNESHMLPIYQKLSKIIRDQYT